jgi:hypothetical protein
MTIGKIGGSSYYKTIKAKKYDAPALRTAKRAEAGERDGRISKGDAKRVASKLVDQKQYTVRERRTAALIRKEGNLTAAGARELDHEIRRAGQLHKAPALAKK